MSLFLYRGTVLLRSNLMKNAFKTRTATRSGTRSIKFIGTRSESVPDS